MFTLISYGCSRHCTEEYPREKQQNPCLMTPAEERSCRINTLVLDWLVLCLIVFCSTYGLYDGSVNSTLAYSLLGVSIPYALLTIAETCRQVIQAKRKGELSHFCCNFFLTLGSGMPHRELE